MPTIPTLKVKNRQNTRDFVLRGLFALALAWAFLNLGFEKILAPLFSISEGSGQHNVIEFLVLRFVAIVAATILLAIIIKLKPGFLSVPKHVTSLRLCSLLLATTVIIGAVLPLIVLAATIILVPPTPHPDNVQYIPPVFWVTPFAVITLTPVVSILVTWMWIISRKGETN